MTLWRFNRRAAAKALLLSCVVVVFAGAAISWWVAEELVSPRRRVVGPPPEDFPAEQVTFASESGDRLVGWYRPGEPGKGVVVFAHGIRGDRRASLPRARLLAEAGYSTLLFDLRSHGESSGDRITLGHLERHDIAAAVAYARRRNPGEPVGVVGFSLGGAAAALAAPLGVDAVVLEAVFPTIERAISNRTQMRLGSLGSVATWALAVQLQPRLGVSCDDLRPVDSIALMNCPVLIVGGSEDHQTTPNDTRQLFAAAAEPKELAWFEGLGHNNYAWWQPEEYRALVVRFLDRHLATAKD